MKTKFLILAIFSFCYLSFAEGKSLVNKNKKILTDVSFGVKVSTMLDRNRHISLENYEVDIHILKLLIFGGFDLESNVVVEGLKDKRIPKIQGVLSKKIHKNLSIGFAVESDLKTIKQLDHNAHIRLHNFYDVKKLNPIIEVVVDTKRRKFSGVSGILNLGNGYQLGGGLESNRTVFVVGRVSLL